jgi:hypothetical protein
MHAAHAIGAHPTAPEWAQLGDSTGGRVSWHLSCVSDDAKEIKTMKSPTPTTRVPLLLTLAGTGFVLWPSELRAQCNSDSGVCVYVEVERQSPQGPPPPAAERAPPASVPKVIIVEVDTPAPPPPPAPAPPPPPVATALPPPPPAPELELHVQADTPAARAAEPRLGLQSYFGTMGGGDVKMRGFGNAFRVRPVPSLALDFGIGSFTGQDANGMDRWEVPFSTDLVVFVNPRRRLQLYFVGGVGLSYSMVDGDNVRSGTRERHGLWHMTAQTGVGLEWRIGRHFAINADWRVFLRQPMDGNDSTRERAERRADGTRATDTSTGTMGRIGATFYFGRS